MCVEDVEFLKPGNFDNFARKRRSIKGEIEQGVTGNLDFMVHDISDEAVQTDWHGVADKMDLVAALGQNFAEFSRNDPAPPVRRVT
jgi:hypothetical protein